MLEFLTVIIMGLVAYAYLVEGFFHACVMCCNVVFAGIIAFNFWEPLATLVEPGMGGSGYEDFLILIALFGIALGALRTITSLICPSQIDVPQVLQKGGGALFGVITGYLAMGFLACALQTLPWNENFMYFNYRVDASGSARSFLPPDRLWLATMHRLGVGPLAKEGPTFDQDGTFAMRYARHRRYLDAPAAE